MDDATRFPFLPQVLSGDTADVYFLRTAEVLRALELDPVVGMEVFPERSGTCCGIREVAQLLTEARFDGEFWGVDEGEPMTAGEAVLEIFGRYSAFGMYETAIIGILAAESGWCSAAREVVDAAGDVPVVSFGARHVHPNVAGQLDYAAVIGGCVACSTTLGAALAATEPSGTMPHALLLIVGDTVATARAFHATVDDAVPRVVLVDTFQDEVVESLRVAEALGDALFGVRLDTPRERGGVTAGLVHEVRARLDAAGYAHVRVVVSGGVTPDRIRRFRETQAPVDSFGVGSYISGAVPIDFTADIREIEGKPVAKRGRIPGMQRSGRLHQLL
jgi:nicotinate phosphoribosyltransferase